jgi:hypothetical protein
MFRKLLLSCAALFAATACSPLAAHPLVDIAIVDRDAGQWLPQYRHGGDAWVPGIPGHRYALRLTNTSGERVLVVLSVDGVNAVSGEDADPAQGGYVLAPWESAEIAGWRKSLDDIAQFYFTDLPDSYAARTGRPDNVGVIGIAVFREARPLRIDAPSIIGGNEAESEARAPSPAADKAIAQQRIGTGHGAREWSPVGETQFMRASRTPMQVTQLRYDAPQRLAALGIVPRPPSPRWPRPDAPQAFPGHFVADPPRD